ncbi:hypothetical protein [Treponema pedis]|uniref:hypothetical protein n=1 Tax=Treponema pedis TaxID=409322 RepID=UPI00040A0E8C
MNDDHYLLEVLDLKISQIISLIKESNKNSEQVDFFKNIPEWVNIETACLLKGGGALETYKTKLFLQPCCGTNYRYVCGRKTWRKEDVIEWLSITDNNLKPYAERFGVTLPANYERRSQK